MNGKKSQFKVNISSIYAISLTPEKKRQLMGRIHREVQQRKAVSDENVSVTCNHLNQCFEPELDSILLAMEIVAQLLSRRVAEKDVIQSYRKLLTYVSSALHESNCSKIAIHFTRISTIALQSTTLAPEGFPVSILKCILVLMYQLPISDPSERKIILEAVRSTLQWSKRIPESYTRCGLGSLIRCAITSSNHLRDDRSAVAELICLVRTVLDTFYTPQTSDVHPVEVLLRSAYDNIFNRLAPEWADTQCYQLLLYVLFDFLKRDVCTHLKLDIVRKLADAAGGGTRRLVRLLCVPRHLRDEQLRRKLKTTLTIILANSLFRYESTKRVPHFRGFLKTIEAMLDGVDFDELVKAKFLCLNLARTSLTIQCVCFVFIVRHLDLLEGITSKSTELDYVYNLIASVNIVYHKRWKLPNFLMKHFIDGLSRFSKTEIFEKNVSDSEKKMQAIFSGTAPATVRVNDAVANIFGRLPATAQRIEWIHMQPDYFRAKFIFHQQLGILQERYIVACDEGLVHSLLTIFQTDTLLEVLSSKQASPMARRNASVLLSRCSLTGPALEKVLRQIKRSHAQEPLGNNTGTICNWVRAVHGSVQGLNKRSKRVLWSALSTFQKTTQCSDEQRLLLVDTRACLLVSMMHEMEGTVVEMQVERTRNARTAPKRKLL